MNIRKLALILSYLAIAFTISSTLNAQDGLTWQHVYGSSNWDSAGNCFRIDDGWLLFGSTNHYARHFKEIMVMYIDREGELEDIDLFGEQNRSQHCYSAIRTEDGGYMVVGRQEVEDRTRDALLLKLDSDLEETWRRTYEFNPIRPAPADEYFSKVFQLGNGNYVAYGQWRIGIVVYGQWVAVLDQDGEMINRSEISHNWVPLIVDENDEIVLIFNRGELNFIRKITVEGELIWEHQVSPREYGILVETSDGDYLALGGGHEDNRNYYLTKFDNDGEIIWERTRFPSGNLITEVEPGSFLQWNGDRLRKFNRAGVVQWSQRLEYPEPDRANAVPGHWKHITLGFDDDYVFFGSAYIADLMFGHLDSDGEIIDWSLYGSPGGDEETGGTVLRTDDGGYLIAGSSYIDQQYYGQVQILKTNSDGDSLWSRRYGDSLDYRYTDFLPMEDGGYLLGGDGYDYFWWLWKIDADCDILWQQNYADRFRTYRCRDILITSDGSIVMAGGRSQSSLVIRLDGDGEIISRFERDLGIISGIVELESGGFALLSEYECMLLITDEDFRIRNRYYVGYYEEDVCEGFSIVNGPEDVFYILGYAETNSDEGRIRNYFINFIDRNGELVWRTFLPWKENFSHGAAQLAELLPQDDGSLIFCASFLTLRLNENGQVIQGYSAEGNVFIEKVTQDWLQIDDENLICTGTYGEDVWIYNLDLNALTDTIFTGPRLTVNPDIIEFVNQGDVEIVFIELGNEGDDTLQIVRTAVYPDDMITVDPRDTITLAPRETFEILLVFTPEGDSEFEAILRIDSNDPVKPIVEVPVNIRLLDADDNTNLPIDFRLYPPYPNPFNSFVTIRYDLPGTREVLLIVSDLTGRTVAVLTDDQLKAGRYKVTLNATNLSSGIYILRLLTDDDIRCSKLLLIK